MTSPAKHGLVSRNREAARRILAILASGLLGVLLFADAVRGADVVPSARVTTLVNVRAEPSAKSEKVGSLSLGQRAKLLGSVPRWYRIELVDGTTGFANKAYTDLAEESSGPVFTIDAVDVGTGLAILVRGADFTLLYDGGSNDDRARGDDNRLAAYLHDVAPELSTIDHVILSHPHQDHVELLPDIIDHYIVREIWDSGARHTICGYRHFLKAIAAEEGIQYHDALHDAGSVFVEFAAKECYGIDMPAETVVLPSTGSITDAPVILGDSAVMRFLHADGGHHSSFNENSVVVRLDLGDTRVLLMGDAEAGGRKSPSTPPAPKSVEGLLLTCCSDALAADVLVVGHHGSKTSSRRAFLDAVGASTFIVSTGPMKYGSIVLPDPDVIVELMSRGAVYRTDVNDADCEDRMDKVGPDADGKAGGCDNIRITINNQALTAEYVP